MVGVSTKLKILIFHQNVCTAGGDNCDHAVEVYIGIQVSSL